MLTPCANRSWNARDFEPFAFVRRVKLARHEHAVPPDAHVFAEPVPGQQGVNITPRQQRFRAGGIGCRNVQTRPRTKCLEEFRQRNRREKVSQGSEHRSRSRRHVIHYHHREDRPSKCATKIVDLGGRPPPARATRAVAAARRTAPPVGMSQRHCSVFIDELSYCA